MRRHRGISFADKVSYEEWLKQNSGVLSSLQKADRTFDSVHQWLADVPKSTMGAVIKAYKECYARIRQAKNEIDDRDYAAVEKELASYIGRLEAIEKIVDAAYHNAHFRL